MTLSYIVTHLIDEKTGGTVTGTCRVDDCRLRPCEARRKRIVSSK